MTGRLWPASLVVCGLFVGEDPTIVGVRAHVNGSATTRAAFDVLLATLMIAYNFAGSRYIVATASGQHILRAIDEVDRRRALRVANTSNRLLRTTRRVLRRANPFDLIKSAGDRLGRSMDRISSSARQHRLRRAATVLEDLGAVNVLGVPGAGLAMSTAGYVVTRRHSLRHSTLFVASWFVGAHVVARIVGALHALPLIGWCTRVVTGAIGTAFTVLTDVAHPIGACTVAALTIAVIRYSRQVERTVRELATDPA